MRGAANVSDCLDTAFRVQLVLPEQQRLYDYWSSKFNGDRLPGRAQICPTDLVTLLPNISLVDIDYDPYRFRFRLAGTRLREIYDREVTGLDLADKSFGAKSDYWQRTCVRICETSKPAQGVIRGPGAEKEHLVQFWLRLPMSTTGSRPDMLLCHDAVVPAEELPGTAENLLAKSRQAAAG